MDTAASTVIDNNTVSPKERNHVTSTASSSDANSKNPDFDIVPTGHSPDDEIKLTSTESDSQRDLRLIQEALGTNYSTALVSYLRTLEDRIHQLETSRAPSTESHDEDARNRQHDKPGQKATSAHTTTPPPKASQLPENIPKPMELSAQFFNSAAYLGISGTLDSLHNED
ncbi:hypothetical protein B0T17DRAFT_511871 [Bombardia bombarda]|uniref:Uncharacterized protein n=1 Tax=Bombardia bombarda TaxID=252184 RepID=A0AA39U1B1_9PEZI|nr:hypothetical protein B0T17DRAFT_511871 [Bombardia bombarda]